MSWDNIDGAVLVLEAYVRLRKSGFKLGIDEYLAGLALVNTQDSALPFARNLDSLKQSLKLIWCNSRSEQRQFEPIWDEAVSAARPSEVVIREDNSEPTPAQETNLVPPRIEKPKGSTLLQDSPQEVIDAAAQPIKSPFTPAEVDHPLDLQSYWPVSRRSLSYSWRYLRRNMPEGPADIVDVSATISKTAQQGFYLEPVMEQRDYNRAQLLLLIDQNGSMMPIHQFTREIVDTALHESGLPKGQVTVCYFQNVPSDYVYTDTFLTEPVALSTVLDACNLDTSVLVVSDGGAARGFRRLDRIRSTTRFLRRLRQTTTLCAWLNPVPQSRWEGSSAEIMANLVPMFQMDDDGLSNAIDVVRGLQVKRL